MGIKGLAQVIQEYAPDAIKKVEIKHQFGRKIAIDASMSIYSFMIAVRSGGEQLTSESGETTSHLMGIFYRTLRMVENGVKPVYVFDGKPPTLKSGELAKRTARKSEAQEAHEEAKETGTAEEIEKFARRTVRVTKEHNEECKKLLNLMGIPYVDAPTEAEAQCAVLARAGKVYAAATEDMDTLCFDCPVLIRHLTFSEQRNAKEPIQEIYLDKVLTGLDMTRDQFIDLCILLGCDYCETIPKVGPKSALELIRKHGSLEGVVKFLETSDKYKLPEDWPWQDVRELLLKPDVAPAEEFDFKWNAPDTEGLVKFLVDEKGFNIDRVKNGAKRLETYLKSAQQGRLDGFFKVLPKTEEQVATLKRKNAERMEEKKKKQKQEAAAKKGAKGKPKGAA
ncbi:PIN domain-like protein [Terfezia boudieri ATCC MYA-4762]|uniref:Flap endonuclease 1 n=1 Tax=Terfezia boudieri ATCC MYA-4762 TaxID=1051890 RepID=A0A3N4LEZ4_9PEZI|nr:PIN domain-like protein [Terfezia boudieri ATCC MYA-4762]